MHTCYYRCGGKLTLLWKLVIIKFRALGIKGGYKKLFQGEFQVPSISNFSVSFAWENLWQYLKYQEQCALIGTLGQRNNSEKKL